MAKRPDDALTFRTDEGIIVAVIFLGLITYGLYLIAPVPIQNVMASVIGQGDAYIIGQFMHENPFLYRVITTGTVTVSVISFLAGFIIGGNPGMRKWVVEGSQLLKGKEGIAALQEVEFELMSQAQVERRILNIPTPKPGSVNTKKEGVSK